MKRFLFRCDVSPSLGTGHLRRCLALAGELRRNGAGIFFLCRDEDMALEGLLAETVRQWEHMDWRTDPFEDAQRLAGLFRTWDIDAAVVDHYRTDADYQMELLSAGVRWLQFDGRPHKDLWADWVFNASPVFSEQDYRPYLRRRETRLLVGPQYALLRPEFAAARTRYACRRKPERILLTFGGGDDRGAALLCLEALSSLETRMEYVVLLSSLNPGREAVELWVKRHPELRVRILIDTPDVAECMADADLALIAGGITSFEAAALGVPACIIQIAGNQKPNCEAWHAMGTAVYLGAVEQLDGRKIVRTVKSLLNNGQRRRAMSARGRQLVDGNGTGCVSDLLIGTLSGVKQ